MALVPRICKKHGRLSLSRWGRCCAEDENPDAPPIPSREEILAHVRRVHGVNMGGGRGLGILLGVGIGLVLAIVCGVLELYG